jgi:MarR family 2-MHQ and catechol resistance regulon transcriptional repressor
MPKKLPTAAPLAVNNRLEQDAWELHEALTGLVRLYQFRDRRRICYYGISVTQCYAISALTNHGQMSLNGLADELNLDKSTTSRMIDSLEKKGLAHRSADPGDGRAVCLEATSAGRELQDVIERELVDDLKLIIEDFEPEVRQAASELISRLASATTVRFAAMRMNELSDSE